MQEEDLIEHLRCPDCRQKITLTTKDRLVCTGCKRVFAIDNNYIQMLPTAIKKNYEDDAWKVLPREGVGRPAWMALLHKKDRVLYFYERILPRVVFKGRILEVGAGTAWASALIKKKQPKSFLVATDISPYALEKAISVTSLLDSNVDYRIACNAELLPFSDGYFDIVLSNATLHHFPNPQKGICEIRRVLKKGGRCCALGEIAAGPPFKAILTSRLGSAGKRARSLGIEERIYSLREWKHLFKSCGFQGITITLDKTWEYKLYDWFPALYYRFLTSVPDFLVGNLLPSNVDIYANKS